MHVHKLLLPLGDAGGKVQHIILAEGEEVRDRQCMMLKEFSVHLRFKGVNISVSPAVVCMHAIT